MLGLIADDGNRSERRDEEDAREGEGEGEEKKEGRVEDEDEAEGDSFDSDDEPQEIPQKLPRVNAVYNSIALHDKLEEIGWTDGFDWIQTLGVSYDQPDEIDVDDDLTREMAFYTQALEATREAYSKLQESGLPFLRPEDYYAEMVKSDTHMLKLKDKLLAQQKQNEEVDVRKKSREAKRFAKEVQAQKFKERAQQKKHNIDSVKKWRKKRQKDRFTKGEDEFPVGFEDEDHSSNKRRKLDARKMSREAKRFTKEVRAQQKKQNIEVRAQQKKQHIDSVKKWRKNIQKDRFTKGEDEFPVGFQGKDHSSNKRRKLNAAHGDRPGGNSGEGLPRNKEGAAAGKRHLGLSLRPPRFDGDRPRFGDRDGYSSSGPPRGPGGGFGGKGGAPEGFQPSFRSSGGRPRFDRGGGGFGGG